MLADWRTAPVGEPLRSTLGLLETLTLRPDELTPGDVDVVRAAGASDDAILQAALVCVLFNTIDRIADALDFEIPSDEQQRAVAPLLLEMGYSSGANP